MLGSISHLCPCPYGPETRRPYNYSKTNWKVFEIKLKEYLPIIDPSTKHIKELDQFAKDISEAIRRATEETTPLANICPFSKRWCNKDIENLRKQAQRSRRKFIKYERQEDGDRWKKNQKNFQRKVKESKRNTWQNFVSKADERDIWIVNKYLNSIPTNTYIPTLEGKAATNSQKTETLSRIFFPPPPAADLSDIPNANYPEPVTTNHNITSIQVNGQSKNWHRIKPQDPMKSPIIS